MCCRTTCRDARRGLRLQQSRLDGYAHLVAKADPADAARQAVLARMRAATKASMVNLPRLAAQAAAAA